MKIGIKLEIEEDVPDLALLPNDDVSISSSESGNISNTTYCDLDNLVDDIVDYTSVLKNHSKLVCLIQTLTKVDTAMKKTTNLLERETPDKLFVFAVTTHVQNKADKVCEMPPEEPPTEVPPPEPPLTANVPSTQPQVPALNNGEIGLPDMEDNLFSQPIKVTGRPHTSKHNKRDWKTLCPLFGWLDADTIRKRLIVPLN